MDQLFALLIGYFCGSIPFGLLLAKAAGEGDIRNIGSGNIGATNVLRTGNKGLAAGVLLLDMAKGFLPVMIAHHAFGNDGLWYGAVQFAAIGAVLGHCFPVWLRFKGGKGVATNLGVSLGLALPIGLAYALVWLAVLAVWRFSSLAGMSAVVAAAIAATVSFPDYAPVSAIIAVLVIWLHRANIARLLGGTEPKVGAKS